MRPIVDPGDAYILLPSEEGVDINNLEFIEFSAYVERALSSKGMTRVNEFNSAETAVFLSYGIGDPEKNNYSYSLPVWGQTGVASSYTTGTVNTYSNTATFTGTTTYVPQYGITGSQSLEGSYTTYTRHIFLTAYDLVEYRQSEKELMIWDTRIVSTGSSGDLRRVFPVMIAAAINHLGTNTNRILNVTLKEEDDEVRFIKGELQTIE